MKFRLITIIVNGSQTYRIYSTSTNSLFRRVFTNRAEAEFYIRVMNAFNEIVNGQTETEETEDDSN